MLSRPRSSHRPPLPQRAAKAWHPTRYQLRSPNICRARAMAQSESLLQRRRFRSILSLGPTAKGPVARETNQKENVMPRFLLGSVIVLGIFAVSLPAQEGIQRGKIKKVDADKGTITITAGGKDLELVVAEQTRIVIGNE